MDTLTYDRLLALLSGFFGVIALGLAAIGIYGVVSYSVTRRTSEIGCAGGLYVSRFVESLLFGVKPADPVTIVLSAAVLAGVSMPAAWVPARRAASVDPVLALRYE